MYDSITFQTFLVSIVIYCSTKGICINAQVSYTHRLKQQAKCIKVVDEILGANTQGSNCNGRVDEVSGKRGTDSGLGT